jgi:PAS domain S-box-containing protein
MNDRIHGSGTTGADTAEGGGEREQMRMRALAALRRGEFDLAEAAIARGDATLAELVENLRIYQMELQMQADELQRSQARTEQALDRFTTLFMNLPVPALLVDGNGVVLEANRHAEEGFGVSSAMMRGYLFHTRDLVPFPPPPPPGAQIVGDLHIESLADPVSDVHQYACVMIDRTQQLADLERLQTTVAQLKAREAENLRLSDAALRHAHAVLVLDAGGRITWASDEAMPLTGYAPAELLGHPVLKLLGSDDSTMADCSKRIAEGSAGRYAAVRLRRKDGQPAAVALDLMAVKDSAAPRFIVLLTEQARTGA